MKYYVFGTNSECVKIGASKALFKSESIDSAYDNFIKYKEENRFEYIYLLVDFESVPEKLFTCKTFNNDYSEVVPYLILAIYDKKSIELNCKRSDSISIYTKGFKRQFNDNVVAMMCFENYLYKHEHAELRIEYIKGQGKFDRFLSSTTFSGKKYPTKRFELTVPNWEPIISQRVFKMPKIEEAV